MIDFTVCRWPPNYTMENVSMEYVSNQAKIISCMTIHDTEIIDKVNLSVQKTRLNSGILRIF